MTNTDGKPLFFMNLIGVATPDGGINARGFMTGPNGALPVDCKFPSGVCVTPVKRGRGRSKGGIPKKATEHVATLAHLSMSKSINPEWGKTARVLHFRETVWHRSNPDVSNEYRDAMRWVVFGEKMTKSACGHVMVIPTTPDQPPCWFAMDSTDAFKFDQSRNLTGIDSIGWFCRWGDKKATYGRITSIPTESL